MQAFDAHFWLVFLHPARLVVVMSIWPVIQHTASDLPFLLHGDDLLNSSDSIRGIGLQPKISDLPAVKGHSQAAT